MLKMKKTLGIVPARAGSKGLPGKNIKSFCGKPLIAWTIEAAQQSCIDDVVVSTDSEDIASIALAFGARVPFLRPESLATDSASSVDVILHALEEMKALGNHYEYVIMLEPTSPLRTNRDISEAMRVLSSNKEASAIVGITQCVESHPSFIYRKCKDDIIVPYTNTQPTSIRRQDISECYYLEGSIYASEVPCFVEMKSFYHERTMGFIMPKSRAIEIDDMYDFIMAEALMMSGTRL